MGVLDYVQRHSFNVLQAAQSAQKEELDGF